MRELIEQYKRGEISRKELESGVRDYWQTLEEPDEYYRDFEGEEMWSYIMQHGRQKKVKRMYWPRYAVAAAILALIVGSYFYFSKDKPFTEKTVIAQTKRDIAPGHAGAILTLSNGKQIMLDSAHNGALAMDGSIKVIKENGEIKYIGEQGEVIYNNIKTDKGRTWSVILPDGSKAWLNASSSIHYPLSFTGKERLVEITGEAYFEVVHNTQQPFRVKVGDKVVEDIGTAFNINSYDDEPVLVVTVLEGRAGLQSSNSKVELAAGKEGIIAKNANQITTRNARGQDAIAWKNGLFKFTEPASIDLVLRQISRWYDITIQYPNGIPNKQFWGGIQRNLPLSEVLEILQQSKVTFRIEGRELQVLQ